MKQVVRKALSQSAYSAITNKDDLNKDNDWIKEILQANGYQESTISKIFQRITNNHRLSSSVRLSHNNKLKPWISKKKRSELSINSPYVKGLSAKLGLYTRWGPVSIMKTPWVIYFLNLKLEFLQQVETASFMILVEVSVKQSTSVNLSSL